MQELDESIRSARGQLAKRINRMVWKFLKNGARPSDITAMMTFVAADMGFSISNDKENVLAAVNEGVNFAIQRDERRSQEAIDEQEHENESTEEEVLH